jgi:signal transduction histidine kinase
VILENLLENAIQFRSPRPVFELRVYTETDSATRLDRSSAGNGDDHRLEPGGTGLPVGVHWLVMKLTDNGEGIHPAWQDKIFDLYVRASECSKGNGLGLYVVRKLVEQFNGTVTLRSEPCQGAVFTVRLTG